MSSPARRILASLPGVLSLAVYLVLATAPTAPVDAQVDTGLSTGTGTGTGQHATR